MDLRNGVLAQENTLPYLLLQPVAALGFVLALAVAVSHGVRPPVGYAPSARRLAPAALLNLIATLVAVGRPR